MDALRRLAEGRLPGVAQPDAGVTYAAKIDKAEAAIDWTQPAAAIERKLRALDPAPGASGRLGGEVVKLWRAGVLPGRGGRPGEIVDVGDAGIVVACGEGALCVTELQRAGGRRAPAAAFLAGCREAVPGACFETSPSVA